MLGKIILLTVAVLVASIAAVSSKHHSDNYINQIKKFYLHGYNLKHEKKSIFRTDKDNTH